MLDEEVFDEENKLEDIRVGMLSYGVCILLS